MNLIPTGLGASFGGYAGDGAPVTNLLASACDLLIAHPNALNAANFLEKRENVLYVEGYGIDRFVEEDWGLRRVRSNRIGLLIDCAAEKLLPSLLNAANATRAHAGIEISGFELTKEPVGAKVLRGVKGNFQGEIANPDTLLQAAKRLVDGGAEAIAIACPIDLAGFDDEGYASGNGPDPIGGIEAILSHLVVSEFGIPAAHAPADLPWLPEGIVEPRLAAEACGTTYLPCILLGLARAPRFVLPSQRKHFDLFADDLDILVAPYGCFGGPPMLACQKRKIDMIAVRENSSVLSVTPESLGMSVLIASTYFEAAGMLLALKEGLSFDSLRRPIPALPRP